MKQIIFALALTGVFCTSAAETGDSFLYWMVEDTLNVGEKEIKEPYEAKVVAIQGNLNTDDWVYQGADKEYNYLSLYGQPYGNTLGDSVRLGEGNNLAYFAGLGGTGDGWTYFIELYNESGIFAHSDAIYYSQDAVVTLIEGTTNLPTGMPLDISSFTPASVPEPNSALLMLIGCAALALRRRKQAAA